MITFGNCGSNRPGKTEPDAADPCSCGTVTVTLELVSEDAAQGGYYLAPHIYGYVFSEEKGEEDGLSTFAAYLPYTRGGSSVDPCQATSWDWTCVDYCYFYNSPGPGSCPDGSGKNYEECCTDLDNKCPDGSGRPIYCRYPCYVDVPINSENKNGRKTFTLARSKKYHISWYADSYWAQAAFSFVTTGNVCKTPVKYSWKITVGTADDLDKEGANPDVIAEGEGTARIWTYNINNPPTTFSDDNLLEKVSFTAPK